jgi:hypothetical protein
VSLAEDEGGEFSLLSNVGARARTSSLAADSAGPSVDERGCA